MKTVADVGENALIAEILGGAPVGADVIAGAGDDCAVVRMGAGKDVLLLKTEIEGDGVACHTGARSCFYRSLDLGTHPTRPVSLTRSE